MTTTAHEDQFTIGTQTIEPVRQPYSTEAILRRNIADAEKEMQRQAERAESYAEALRSLASYVGAGGYNADTVDAAVFEEKIRWGIGEIMERMEKVEAELTKLREQTAVAQVEVAHGLHKRTTNWLKTLPDGTHLLYAAPVESTKVTSDALVVATARAFLNAERDYNHSFLRGNGGSKTFELKEAVKSAKKNLEEALNTHVPAPAEIIELSKKYAIDTEAYHAAMDALLQSTPQAPAVPAQKPFCYISQYEKTCMVLGDTSHATVYRELHPDGDDDGIALYIGPVPAVPNDIIPEGDDFNGTTPHLIQCIESLVRLDAKGVLVPHGIGRDASKLLTAAANRLRQQAPAVPAEWKQAVSEFLSSHDAAWAELFKTLPADTRSVTVSDHQANAVRKANALRALLQSAEVPPGDKLQLTPVPTHPVDRNTGEVRHD